MTEIRRSPPSRQPKLVPVEILAAQFGDTDLPSANELPPSYQGSTRMWLNRKLRALQGKNAQAWKSIKADPEKHQRVAQQNNSCSRAYRKRKREMSPVAHVDTYLSIRTGAV
jgi:hypothetical protein